jgi:hypothetical protein
MENRIMRNEADLLPFVTDDGEAISVVELAPAPEATPIERLLEKEDAARFEQFQANIRLLLSHERLILKLFDCFCAGISKPKALAKALKRPVRDLQKLQRQLRRRMTAFLDDQSPGKPKIQAK